MRNKTIFIPKVLPVHWKSCLFMIFIYVKHTFYNSVPLHHLFLFFPLSLHPHFSRLTCLIQRIICNNFSVRSCTSKVIVVTSSCYLCVGSVSSWYTGAVSLKQLTYLNCLLHGQNPGLQQSLNVEKVDIIVLNRIMLRIWVFFFSVFDESFDKGCWAVPVMDHTFLRQMPL